jgi:capsular exopolysaccharide synthesis family protein
VTLSGYLRVLAERWRLVAAFVLAGTAVAVLVTLTSTKVYQADVQMFVRSSADTNNSNVQFSAVGFTQAQAQTFAQIVASPGVVKRVKGELNLAMPDSELKSKISATAPVGQSIVELHVQDTSPLRAAAIANRAADAFADQVQGYYRIPPQNPGGEPTYPFKVFVTDPAVAPSSPVSPNPFLNVTLGLLLGLLVGAGLAVVRHILDNRIKDPDTFAKVAGKPTMGIVIDDPGAPKFPIATRAGPRNARAENFRQLRANLQFANIDKHPRVIAVTSSIPGEGKTMVSMNLASALADAGFTVCLVDADLRRPTVARTLGLAGPVGLTSVLIQQIGLSEALQSAGPNLYVLASGPVPPNPSEVLASTYVRDIIRSLLDKVDYVVIDTAPLLPVSDGSEVAALADGTLLVAKYESTTDNQVKRAVATLRGVDAKLIGVVLNRAPRRRASEYGYSYSYYSRDPNKEASAGRRRAALRRPAPTPPTEIGS